jgi:pimeloyl-ACP methyl ester carboxylesterase
VVVPDMRGYGHSSRPAEVEAYDLLTIAGDLIGLLDWLEADSAVFAGHDWGAVIAWGLALLHPERVRAVAGLSVPPTRHASAPPVSILRRRLGEDFYIVWFQETGPADEALARDVRRTITSREAPGPRWAAARGESRRASWMTSEDLDHYVENFERTGFSGALNYYRNIDRNWELTAPYGDRIDQPAMFLTGERDPVRGFMPAEHLEEILTDLRANVVIAGAGHWVQQERPDEVNQALIAFLDGLD